MLWGCMTWGGVGYATRIEGKIDAGLYVSIMEDELQQKWSYGVKLLMMWYFSRTLTPNTPAKRPRSRLKTIIPLSSSDLHSLLTLIL